MAKTALLVLGIIAIAVGGILTFIFSILLAYMYDTSGGYSITDIAPGFWFFTYLWLIVGIVLICVGILLLILKARSKD